MSVYDLPFQVAYFLWDNGSSNKASLLSSLFACRKIIICVLKSVYSVLFWQNAISRSSNMMKRTCNLYFLWQNWEKKMVTFNWV